MKKEKLKENLKGQKTRLFRKKSLYGQEEGARNYKEYHLQKKEKLLYGLQGVALFGALGYLFFQELLIACFLCLGTVFYLKRKEKEKGQERRDRLSKEFTQGAEAFLNALEAGYSKENAIREAIRDLEGSGQKESLIIPEFTYIQRQLSVNQTIEGLFLDLGLRSGIEDVKTFGEIFSIAGKKGGNLIQIIKKTVGIMKEKQALLQEIRVQTAAKRMEFRIMCLVVPGMILYLQMFSPGFLSVLYHNLLGQLFMGMALAAYLGAILLGERMIEVEM
jgi:tight adherence protein B